MGNSAKMDIFVGISLQELDLDLDEDLFPFLPPALLSEDSVYGLSQFDDTVWNAYTNGLKFEIFESSGEAVGFGVSIFHGDWDDGCAEFPLGDILQSQLITSEVELLFRRWGLKQEVRVLYCLDHS